MALNSNNQSPQGWCLVLVVWGDKYNSTHINSIVQNVFRFSKNCVDAVLMTDCLRHGIDQRIRQYLIPDQLNCQSHKNEYTIKLTLFDERALPLNLPCVYLDLDTVVIGDLGLIAGLIKNKTHIFMLPPGDILKFGVVRRLFFKLFGVRGMATGNSSMLAFHSGMASNPLREFFRLIEKKSPDDFFLRNDDIFISWFCQKTLKPIPRNLGVMFRREFLTRLGFLGRIYNRSPMVKHRRDQIVAVTFNGEDHKVETLLNLPDGTLHKDSKGRSGCWSQREMGNIKARIIESANLIAPRDPHIF